MGIVRLAKNQCPAEIRQLRCLYKFKIHYHIIYSPDTISSTKQQNKQINNT